MQGQPALRLIRQDELRNYAGRNCHQQVVATVLHPVVSVGWALEPVSMPVVDHVMLGAVLNGKTRTLHPIMVRASAHALGLTGWHAMRVARVLWLRMRTRCRPMVLATLLWPLVPLAHAVGVLALPLRAVRPWLSKRTQRRNTQHHRRQRGGDLLLFHDEPLPCVVAMPEIVALLQHHSRYDL